MNKINLLGKICGDIVKKYTQNETMYVVFKICVNRKTKNEKGYYECDYINCIAWSKTAEIIDSYFDKGKQIALTGRLQVNNYENKEGKRVYVHQVLVEEVYFVNFETKGAKTVTIPKKEEINFEDLKQEDFSIDVDTEEEYLEFRE